jgi:hypothetical protein
MIIDLTTSTKKSEDHYFSGNRLVIEPINFKIRGLTIHIQNANGFTYSSPLNDINRTYVEDVSSYSVLWFTWSELETDSIITFEIN